MTPLENNSGAAGFASRIEEGVFELERAIGAL